MIDLGRQADAGRGVRASSAAHAQLTIGKGRRRAPWMTENAPANGPSRWSDDMKTKTLPMQVRHQNWMLAVRELAGVPTFRPVNESILFCATGLDGIERGMELARLAQQADRDIICAHWASIKAKRPSGYTVVLRDVLSVDVLSDCTAYIWGEDRLAFVSPREKTTIWVGGPRLAAAWRGRAPAPRSRCPAGRHAHPRRRRSSRGRPSRWQPVHADRCRMVRAGRPHRRARSPVLISRRMQAASVNRRISP